MILRVACQLIWREPLPIRPGWGCWTSCALALAPRWGPASLCSQGRSYPLQAGCEETSRPRALGPWAVLGFSSYGIGISEVHSSVSLAFLFLCYKVYASDPRESSARYEQVIRLSDPSGRHQLAYPKIVTCNDVAASRSGSYMVKSYFLRSLNQ